MADPAKRDRRMVWQERERLKAKFDADMTRIARQRTLFVMLTPGHAKDALLKAMLSRAEALIHAGRAEEADAILEFVPSAEAGVLLDRLHPGEGLPA